VIILKSKQKSIRPLKSVAKNRNSSHRRSFDRTERSVSVPDLGRFDRFGLGSRSSLVAFSLTDLCVSVSSFSTVRFDVDAFSSNSAQREIRTKHGVIFSVSLSSSSNIV
jgi:hypothetical protein